jgi:hypothetical protein
MIKSFKKFILEMPTLNTISRNTSGYTENDLDTLKIPKTAKHAFTTETGHKVLVHNDGAIHHFLAQNPKTKKVDMHLTGIISGDEYQSINMRGRKGSGINAHKLLNQIRTDLNYTLVSDVSQSPDAQGVWTNLRKVAGGKMYYRPMGGGPDQFAGKIGPKGQLHAYYGPGKGQLVVPAPPKGN